MMVPAAARHAAGLAGAGAWERDVRARLVAGDHDALAEVDDQFSSLVYGLASRVVGDARAAESVRTRLRRALKKVATALESEGGLR